MTQLWGVVERLGRPKEDGGRMDIAHPREVDQNISSVIPVLRRLWPAGLGLFRAIPEVGGGMYESPIKRKVPNSLVGLRRLHVLEANSSDGSVRSSLLLGAFCRGNRKRIGPTGPPVLGLAPSVGWPPSSSVAEEWACPLIVWERTCGRRKKKTLRRICCVADTLGSQELTGPSRRPFC